jgi:hypothetical protein
LTSYLNDTTIWKSYFMIKFMWIFMLMKYVLLLDIWSLYNMNHIPFDEMTRTPRYGEYSSLLRTYTWFQRSSGYHYFAFFIRNPKWIFEFTGFRNHLMFSKDFGNEERIIIKSLWFWSKRQYYKWWFWCKNL